MIIKYSKSYKNIFKHKKIFFEKNDIELRKILKINNIYAKGPFRKKCKICRKALLRKCDFLSFSIPYLICKHCDHLNGAYEETSSFFEKLYKIDIKNNNNPNSLYNSKFYIDRTKDIYLPKIDFLISVTKKIKSILDFGSGAGYFLNACNKRKIRSLGIEQDEKLIEISRKFNKNTTLQIKNISEIVKILNSNNIDCLSAINVIEHLKDPHMFFKSFIKSNAKFLYISVPLVSFVVILENINQNVFPKQLGGAHTHLFSKKSLNYLFKRYRLKVIGQWWFGTDMADLLRTLHVKNSFTNKNIFFKFIKEYLSNYIDELQSIFDKNKKSQEVHLVLKKF
jgi:SAM-dependent methyltransferase